MKRALLFFVILGTILLAAPQANARTLWAEKNPDNYSAKIAVGNESAAPNGVSGVRQKIRLLWKIKNSRGCDGYSKIEKIEMKINGTFENGKKETYTKTIDVNYKFKPRMGSKTWSLTTNFDRSVDPKKGHKRYRSCNVTITKVKIDGLWFQYANRNEK